MSNSPRQYDSETKLNSEKKLKVFICEKFNLANNSTRNVIFHLTSASFLWIFLELLHSLCHGTEKIEAIHQSQSVAC